MELKTLFATDTHGNVMPGAVAYLYEPGTTTLVSGLLNVDGNPLANPFNAAIDGMLQFRAAPGEYDLRITYKQLDRGIRVQFFDPTPLDRLDALEQFDADLANAADPAKGAGMVGVPGGGNVSQALPMSSVAQFGATGSGTETEALQNACTAAVAAGHRRVFIPFQAFTVASGTDCQGCVVYGADTDLTGRLSNHAGLHNIKVLGQNQSDICLSPSIETDSDPKILWRQSDTKDYCITRKKSKGYCLLGFGKNQTTTAESLATVTNEPTRQRLTDVLDAVWAGVYKRLYSAVNGTWASAGATGAFANVVPAYTGGRALKYWYAGQNGNYLEFSGKFVNGRMRVALLCGTTSSESASISINGGAALSISAVAAASNTIRVVTLTAGAIPDGEAVTVRVTHTGTSGKNLQVIGINFFELCDWREGVEADDFAYMRNSANADYLTQASANDAVIRESVSGLYGLSYHGGETGIASDWLMAGAIVPLAVDQFYVSGSFELRTTAAVSWAAFGGGSITIAATWRPSSGAVSHIAQISGDVQVGEIYTHMFGAPETFSEISFPSKVDLAAAANNTRHPIGRTSRAAFGNPTTGQRITSEMTLYNREQNQYGGAHVWHVVGSYNKLYYGPCLGGKMRITNLGLVSVHRFE